MVPASVPLKVPSVPCVPFDEVAIAYLNFIRLESAPPAFRESADGLYSRPLGAEPDHREAVKTPRQF
jgi:hypothetical protein